MLTLTSKLDPQVAQLLMQPNGMQKLKVAWVETLTELKLRTGGDNLLTAVEAVEIRFISAFLAELFRSERLGLLKMLIAEQEVLQLALVKVRTGGSIKLAEGQNEGERRVMDFLHDLVPYMSYDSAMQVNYIKLCVKYNTVGRLVEVEYKHLHQEVSRTYLEFCLGKCSPEELTPEFWASVLPAIADQIVIMEPKLIPVLKNLKQQTDFIGKTGLQAFLVKLVTNSYIGDAKEKLGIQMVFASAEWMLKQLEMTRKQLPEYSELYDSITALEGNLTPPS